MENIEEVIAKIIEKVKPVVNSQNEAIRKLEDSINKSVETLEANQKKFDETLHHITDEVRVIGGKGLDPKPPKKTKESTPLTLLEL